MADSKYSWPTTGATVGEELKKQTRQALEAGQGSVSIWSALALQLVRAVEIYLASGATIEGKDVVTHQAFRGFVRRGLGLDKPGEVLDALLRELDTVADDLYVSRARPFEVERRE